MKDLPPQCLGSKHPCSSVLALPPYPSGLCGKQPGILRSIPVPETRCLWANSGAIPESQSKQGHLLCPNADLLPVLILRDSSKVEAASALDMASHDMLTAAQALETLPLLITQIYTQR